MSVHSDLANLQDSSIRVYWIREIIGAPEEWVTFLCSDLYCFPGDADSGYVPLIAQQVSDLHLSFLPRGVPGEAVVKVKFYALGGVDTTVVRYQCLVGTATATKEVSAVQIIDVHPNPVTETLYFNSDAIVQAAVILDLNGRFHKVIHHPNQAISVSDLVPGSYLISWKLENGQTGLSRFTKQ